MAENSAQPLAWALERLALRFGEVATDNESARVAVAFAQLAGQVRKHKTMGEAVSMIAGQPVDLPVDAIHADLQATIDRQAEQLGELGAHLDRVTRRVYVERDEGVRAYEKWGELSDFFEEYREWLNRHDGINDSLEVAKMLQAIKRTWCDEGRELGAILDRSTSTDEELEHAGGNEN